MKKIQFLPEHFEMIKDHLESGNPVVFPTESSYGFSGSVESDRVIHRVERIKKRKGKPFLCLVPHFSDIEKYADLSSLTGERKEYMKNISEDMPTTFLLPRKKGIFPEFFPEYEKIGIRKVLYKPLQGFLEYYQKPLFSTSANLSGEAPLYSERELYECFSPYRDVLFVLVGDLPENSPSQIIDVENSSWRILRKYLKKTDNSES